MATMTNYVDVDVILNAAEGCKNALATRLLALSRCGKEKWRKLAEQGGSRYIGRAKGLGQMASLSRPSVGSFEPDQPCLSSFESSSTLPCFYCK